MRIEHIEAILGDGRTLTVPALGEHFSLVVGNNEAGKSSLRRVVRDTVFPPPRPRGNQRKLRTEAGMIAVETPFGPVRLFSPLQPPIGE
ncbi:MAG: AAA family ATPase, partial [Acidimicrobiales bacterium]